MIQQNTKKNLLVIPHVPEQSVKVRSKEIAKTLADKYNVYYLEWEQPNSQGRRAAIQSQIKNFGTSVTLEKENKLTRVIIPVFHLLVARQIGNFNFAQRCNEWQLAKLIKQLNIHVVINASAYLFPCHQRREFLYVYDLVDDHADLSPPKLAPIVESFIKNEIEKADVVTTHTHQLMDIISERYGKKPIYVPNGTDLSDFKSVVDKDILELRRKYGLEGKFVIGFIGNHGSFAGLGFLLEVFDKLKKVMPDAVLFIVGPISPEVRIPEVEGAIFTGPVSPKEIAKYFLAIDIGVLPFDKRPFTDNALPIKVIEYGAARKITVATPLTELCRLQLPYVLLAEQQVNEWINLVGKARSLKWQNEYTKVINQFDWQTICKTFENIIDKKYDKLSNR